MANSAPTRKPRNGDAQSVTILLPDVPDELLSPPRTGWPTVPSTVATAMVRQWGAARTEWLAAHPGMTALDLDDERARRAHEHQQVHPEDRGPIT